MSSLPKNVEKSEFATPKSPSKDDPHHSRIPFLVPSPVPCRRTRTTSQSKLASDSPVETGTVLSFCRNKGHGFVKPDSGEKQLFMHISDVEDDYVLKDGDRIEYRTIPMPPKNTERQAVEVRITKMTKEQHERWDTKPDLGL